MEDEDEVTMPPVSAHGLYTELSGTSRALVIVGIAGKFKTKRACGIITACHSCSKVSSILTNLDTTYLLFFAIHVISSVGKVISAVDSFISVVIGPSCVKQKHPKHLAQVPFDPSLLL